MPVACRVANPQRRNRHHHDRWAAHGEPVFIGAFAPFAQLQFVGERVTLADG